ncbi:hypothetical protein IWX90DRAFT_298787 [Phyllosticta citrichinensis]|uniref:Uncharacterized protein n=1 Tax=Phyllosticta citrichinensis TaxID=1130410 RepID=A0ABR1XKU6_9PEZI
MRRWIARDGPADRTRRQPTTTHLHSTPLLHLHHHPILLDHSSIHSKTLPNLSVLRRPSPSPKPLSPASHLSSSHIITRRPVVAFPMRRLKPSTHDDPQSCAVTPSRLDEIGGPSATLYPRLTSATLRVRACRKFTTVAKSTGAASAFSSILPLHSTQPHSTLFYHTIHPVSIVHFIRAMPADLIAGSLSCDSYPLINVCNVPKRAM